MDPTPKIPVSSREKAINSQRQTLWEEEIHRLREIKDNLGTSIGINEGIIEVVAALNINGISTSASDEGHVTTQGKGDTHYPWVLVETSDKEPDKIFELHKILSSYVDEFYSDRPTSEDIKLKLDVPYAHQFALTSVLNDNSEEKDKMLEKLPQRQKEMADFGRFLKSKFFAK